MLSKTYSCGPEGVFGFPVEVETFVSGGFVSFEIVGLPGAAVKESRDRVRAAISVCGYSFPFGKVTVNLAPADIRKEGTSFDLAIAISTLACAYPDLFQNLDHTMLIGELSLQGKLMPIHGALGMAITAAEHGFRSLILPKECAAECECLENISVYPAENLRQVVEHLSGKAPLPALQHVDYMQLLRSREPESDLKYVKGQKLARRALEVAAAGGHNLLMVGIPGSGKTMLARCLPGILPPLSYEESLETTLIHSASGVLPPGSGLITERPFRSPHHSVSMAAMIGGGNRARPGEVSLAHNGVLFLDELPEFQRNTLESLRQPIEDGYVNITRISGQNRYLSHCMLTCSMNPCPCGHAGSQKKECRCTPNEIKHYLGRISGPLLDRIDIQVEMDAVPIEEIASAEEPENSAAVRERVCKARKLQQERYAGKGYYCNAQLDSPGVAEFCRMTEPAEKLMRQAVERFNISMRTYSRIHKVARTVADLTGHELIEVPDLTAAIQFRNMEGKYWS